MVLKIGDYTAALLRSFHLVGRKSLLCSPAHRHKNLNWISLGLREPQKDWQHSTLLGT